jgi:hypothetical protein
VTFDLKLWSINVIQRYHKNWIGNNIFLWFLSKRIVHTEVRFSKTMKTICEVISFDKQSMLCADRSCCLSPVLRQSGLLRSG